MVRCRPRCLPFYVFLITCVNVMKPSYFYVGEEIKMMKYDLRNGNLFGFLQSRYKHFHVTDIENNEIVNYVVLTSISQSWSIFFQ